MVSKPSVFFAPPRGAGAYPGWNLTMVTGVVNMLLSSMSTGLRDEGATVSNSVFNTPNASGESRCICEDDILSVIHYVSSYLAIARL